MKILNCLFLVLFISLVVVVGGTFHRVLAIPMDSSRFRIDSVNIEVSGNNKSSYNYALSDTSGQLAAKQFSTNGYIAKTGSSIAPFRFSISNSNVNFEALVPSKPSTSSTSLIVYLEDGGQYQVTAVEEGPLKTQSGNGIPDTTCNGGNNSCNESLAKIWSSRTAYGFGYNMSNDDIPNDFIDSNYYRPFPDQKTDEPSVTIMSNSNNDKSHQSIITFKTNTSSVQQDGSYQTIINFIATPSY